jgi:3-oxoadipate enol-lactonase
MPVLRYKGLDAYYEVWGDKGAPLVAFVNGVTMRAGHWESYGKALAAAGIRVLAFDMLGQGMSAKPILQFRFEENEDLLIALFDKLKVERGYVTGISYGGLIVLEMPLRFPERIRGIMPMSSFSELDPSLRLISYHLYDAMAYGSFDHFLNVISYFNFSPRHLAKVADRFASAKRDSTAINDIYAIQNLMECLRDFTGFTAELPRIQCPTLIMNAEWDFLTPRHLHEKLRANIRNSRMLLIQHAYHAFALEMPELTQRILVDFVQQVENGGWVGDQSVWIAEESLDAPRVAFPCEGDHTRAIPAGPRP